MRIAFIGLGRMGRELAAHLLDDYDLVVWNRTASAADDLVERGATRAGSAAEAVDGAEVVITTLFGPDTVREVIMDGDLPFKPGTTWIDVTTVSPAEADSFAAWAAEAGLRFVHSPVVGSLAPARAGTLGVLIGGDPEAVEVGKPIVSHWADADRLRSYDTAGKAATDKLINNLALGVAMQGMVEALRLGHSGGLSTEQVIAAMDKSMLTAIKDLKGANVRDGDFSDTQFSTNALAKDAGLMTTTSRFPLPALTATHESLERARRAGHGEDDFSVIAESDRD